MSGTKFCPHCDGDGICPECDGNLYIADPTATRIDEVCEHCEGTGDCPTCDGSGRVPVTQPKYTAQRKGQHVEVSMEHRR